MRPQRHSYRKLYIPLAAILLGVVTASCRKGPADADGEVAARQVVATFSCARYSEPENPADGGQIGEGAMNVARGGTASPETKVITKANSDTVRYVQFFQFGLDGKLISASERMVVNRSTPADKKTAGYRARVSDASYFVVLGNCDEVTTDKLPATQDELLKRSVDFENNSVYRGLDYIPMIGQTQSPVGISSQREPLEIGEIRLQRLFARYELTVQVDGDLQDRFQLRTVRVCQMPGYVPFTAPATGTLTDTEKHPCFSGDIVTLDPDQEKWLYDSVFFMPENLQGVDASITDPVNKAGVGKSDATYIEVSGDYTENGKTARYSYRLYPGANATTDYNIERGAVYRTTVTITGVSLLDPRVSTAAPFFDPSSVILRGKGDVQEVMVHWNRNFFELMGNDWISSEPGVGGSETENGTTKVRVVAMGYNATGVDREGELNVMPMAGDNKTGGRLVVLQRASAFELVDPVSKKVQWAFDNRDPMNVTVRYKYTTFTAKVQGENASHFLIANSQNEYGDNLSEGEVTIQLQPVQTIQPTEGRSAQLVLTPAAGNGNNLIQAVTINLVHNVNFMQPANCFMIAPGESFSFNASIAGNDDAGTNAHSVALKAGIKSVGVVWQTAADGEYAKDNTGGQLVLGVDSPKAPLVTYDPNSYVATVNTNRRGGLGGNALIAAYSGDNCTGDILWSWHVWVTNYSPSEIGTRTVTGLNQKITVSGGEVQTYGVEYQKVNAGKVIMDRNLGALKTYNFGPPQAGDNSVYKMWGYFWQWGRKDPMPQAYIDAAGKVQDAIAWYDKDGNAVSLRKVNVSTAGVIDGTNSLAYTIKNPDVFLYSPKVTADWYCLNTSYKNDALWKEAKTIYDPCPKGWMVARPKTFLDFTGKNSGWVFNGSSQASLVGEGTFPYYNSGQMQQVENDVTCGRLYRDGNTSTSTPIAWWPAGGYRDGGNYTTSVGNVDAVAYKGYSAMCGVTGNNMNYLDLSSIQIKAFGSHLRINGFQIRCVKE